MSTKGAARTRSSTVRSPQRKRVAAESKKVKEQAVVPAVEAPRPGTPEWHLACIADLGQRIQEHVRLMANARSVPSSSAEAREKAIVAFHERLAALERQLGQIHEELRLG